MVAVHVLVPYSQGELVDEIHRTGVVASADFGGAGAELRAHVPLALAQRLQPLRLQMAAAAAEAEKHGGGGDDGGLSDWEEWELGLEEEEVAAVGPAAGAAAAAAASDSRHT